MELEQIISGLEDYSKLVTQIKAGREPSKYEDLQKQYDPLLHEVMNRLDKIVSDGPPVKRAKLPVPMQKLIVEYAVMMCVGNPIQYVAAAKEGAEKGLKEVLDITTEKNRLATLDKQILRMLKSECEVAELWHSETAPEGYWDGTANDGTPSKLRVKLLAPSLGDTLIPIWNMYGDMIAFCRGYLVPVAGDKKEEHFDIYTDTAYYLGKKEGEAWTYTTNKAQFGKIPVVYHTQEHTEWRDVQRLIEQKEMLMSRHADNNAYFAFPFMVATGEIEKFADKGEDGKVLTLKGGGDVKMMTWDNAPASLELEKKTLDDEIFLNTMTPRLSEEQVKGLGNYSGVALKMLFLPAHMKAAKTEEVFGPGVTRRISLLKAWAVMNNPKLKPAERMEITPRFTYFVPKNELEAVQTLTNALSGERPIMSQETAVGLNPLVSDADAEWKRIQKEQESADTLPSGLDRQMRAVI